MKNLILCTFALTFATSIIAETEIQNKYNLDQEVLNKIESRINSMNIDELTERKADIEAQIEEIEETKNTTQNPFLLKELTNLSELLQTENIYIAALLLIANSLIGDPEGNTVSPGDSILPVITILGDNPVIVELGGSYADAGATA